jgi:hypothetical protein
MPGAHTCPKRAPGLAPKVSHAVLLLLGAQTLPVGNTVYLVGGLTDARQVDSAEEPGAGPGLPLVLNTTVAYNTYTETSQQLADMPQPR